VPPSPEAPRPMRCLCATVRRAGRLLTRRYEDALRPAGMTTSQFELMMTLKFAGPGNQTRLASLLETDQTTLSRNLKLLLKERWVETGKDARDARRRTYRLTPLGIAVLREAERCWRRAHEETERLLGAPISDLWPVLERILQAARSSDSASLKSDPHSNEFGSD
jgi:DNA-binding MarR family transcriptional regulator